MGSNPILTANYVIVVQLVRITGTSPEVAGSSPAYDTTMSRVHNSNGLIAVKDL